MDTRAAARGAIRDYYGRILKSTADLKTGACCTDDAPNSFLGPLLANVHPEIQQRCYGCGSPIPPLLDGCTVLDLGCGTGRDVYLLAQLVGPRGRVIGLDMTEEQIALARRHVDWHMDRFGFDRPNVEFRRGYIEDLRDAGLADASVDVVVSNCVLNLSPDKPTVFREIFRVLKPGGELFFSDVFADRRVPKPLRGDPLLLAECLGGALYTEDFRRLMREAGCLDSRVTASRPFELHDPEIAAKIGMVGFQSRTVRAFKLDLEDLCEDYGHVAWYRGSIPGHPHAFDLDDHHRFAKGAPVLICGNTARMLAQTRFAPHFRVEGDFSVHFGPFPCAPAPLPAVASCC